MKKALLLAAIICFNYLAKAQTTMMDDVSPSYLERLIEVGKANYPKFKYTSAKTDAAKANYDKTKWGVLDVFTLGYVYSPGNYNVVDRNGTYSPINGYQMSVFVNVGSVLGKPAVVRGAKQEYVAAKMDKEVIDLNIVQEIRKRYYTYVQCANVLKLKTRAMTDADDVMKHAKYKFEKGEVSFDSYNQGLIAFSKYSQEKIDAEANLLIAKSSLEELLGTTLENIK